MLRSSALRSSTKRAATLHRSIATAHGKTQYTSLTNGVTVATEANPQAKSATLGLWFGAGSTAENPYNNGVSTLLNKIIVNENQAEATKNGLKLGATTDRDYSAYYTQGLKQTLPNALDLLTAKVAQSEIAEASALKYRGIAAQEAEFFEENKHAERVLQHLHATAFQNTPLGLPTIGTPETLNDLVFSDLNKFKQRQFVSSNTVVVATGDVVHDEIVELVEKKFNVQKGEAPEISKPKFLGSEVRLRDDTLPHAYISIAQNGEALNSPNYYNAKVAAAIFGNYNYSEPISRNIGVKLTGIVNENHLADTWNHFSLSYKDAGLWGFSTKISNVGQIDDLVHFALKEWNRLSISISDTEVARGKQLLKNQILFELSTPLAVANDIGSKVVGQGRRPSADEIFAQIDKVNVKSINAWASEKLWDQDVVVAGTGQIEDLLDYNRIRNDTSMLRW
ncbi:Mitochondrial-processing peptidase subunit beta [Wickerhamomyces ciferrii]|uniref:Mitochondrial-processing peptidase subunit beta n=1 Tax=Wickerhamomyces ciferrii (strain ATCC 14091 / BCRC 22168 / CBS 111 / JCM 3599 / NBRC 0793 / NRRL Y-1031 F-60-10) TaxID=1206466 RepID=K0KJI0_WICCF|nr:Mitochondrial-processing peptidase subunit beta [Wickerhamomyces ciferrii]CCH42262.1 Mitochondrial-processing peptidase subunit beta [Wickerhamomyces ciferrii]